MFVKLLILSILGLVFGSFVSALSWRIPKGISIAKGRSICPNCKRKISWYDNIPLLSYLLLGGRCRSCKKHISFRYPLIELSGGFGFAAIYFYYVQDRILYAANDIFGLILVLAIFVILLTIFVIDLEHQIIPDSLIYVGILLIVLLFTLQVTDPVGSLTHRGPTLQGVYSVNIFQFVLPGFLAASFLMFVFIITRGKGMGLGDVKFAVLGGMIVGLKLLMVWLLVSFLTGAIVGIILILGRRAKLKTKIAFGPFLVFGIAIAVVFGNNLLRMVNLL